MKKRKKTFEEEVAEIKWQIANRPSNCKYCRKKIDAKGISYICERTEKQTLFGTKTEKCYGDCEHYEKDIPEMFRDMIFAEIKSKIKNREAEPPQFETNDNLQIWMNGYSQCQRDILHIVDKLSKLL